MNRQSADLHPDPANLSAAGFTSKREKFFVVCPTDEILRSFLSGTTDTATATETVLHIVQCVSCRDRVASWNEKPRLEQILRAFADGSDVGPHQTGYDLVAAAEETKIYPLHPLRRIGQYDLLRSIGRGGGGEVFEAIHIRLRRRLAVKILSKKDTEDEIIRRRFIREMESIGQLDHPHIVHAHDAGEADGTLYLAMELVNGENVEHLARRVGPLPVAEACEIIRQAALGLQHIHEHGLVHRDLKPSNLLTSADGIKIADLGLALLRHENSTDDQLTGHHTILGTADYIAPEQTEKSHHVDIRADIYSLGCTLFRLLSGQPPFTGPENNTPMKKMWAHQSHPIPDIQQFRQDVPAKLAMLLNKLMAKNPSDRFSEPWELAEALVPFSHASDVPSLVLSEMSDAAPAGGNSTERDSVNALKTPSLSSQPTVVELHSGQVRRQSIATIMLSVGVIMLLSWILYWQIRSAVTSPPAKQQGQSDVKVSPAPRQDPPQLQPVLNSPGVVLPNNPILPLGPVATRWKQDLGQLPVEVAWGREMDVGSARIDEGVGALIVQARKSFRFAQLGENPPNSPGLTIRFKVHSQSARGEYGLYFGFRKDDNDPPQFIQFQAIAIVYSSRGEGVDNLLVRRSLEKVYIESGRGESSNNSHIRVQLPISADNTQFEVKLLGNSLAGVKFADSVGPILYTDEQNSYFQPVDYQGPFGCFANDTSAWFSSPRLQWILP